MAEELVVAEQSGAGERYHRMFLLDILRIRQLAYSTSSMAELLGVADHVIGNMTRRGLLTPKSSGKISTSGPARMVRSGPGRGRFFLRTDLLKAAYIVGSILDEHGTFRPRNLSDYGPELTELSLHELNEYQFFYILLGLLNGFKAPFMIETMREYPEETKVRIIFERALKRIQEIE